MVVNTSWFAEVVLLSLEVRDLPPSNCGGGATERKQLGMLS